MSNREKKAGKNFPISQTQSIVFIKEKDERTTTIRSLFALIRQSVHSNSGELMDEERDAIAWAAYLLECLVEDDRSIEQSKRRA